jgi:hypothetical protein
MTTAELLPQMRAVLHDCLNPVVHLSRQAH